MIVKDAGIGLAITLAVTAVLWVVWGPAVLATAIGFGVLGVALFAVAVVAMRDRFQPAPSAIAYLGVLLPLMGLEMNLLRKRL